VEGQSESLGEDVGASEVIGRVATCRQQSREISQDALVSGASGRLRGSSSREAGFLTDRERSGEH